MEPYPDSAGSGSSLSSLLLVLHESGRTESPLCWGSHFLYACGFRFYFTPLPGFFSPFPHGTGSLSVDHEYLALEDGPPIFRQDSTCPALLFATLVPPFPFRIRGYHPLLPDFPDRFARDIARSCRLIRFRSPLLSESRLISVSSPYLDVSVQEVRLTHPMYSGVDDPCGPGFPIRTSPDQSLFAGSPKLFASYYVLHRL